MPPKRDATRRATPAASPLDEARRLFREAETLEARHESDRYFEALKRFLAHAEEHRKQLDDGSVEVANHLDETTMAFYRLSQNDLALRAVEIGLALAPGSSQLLHHKAQILLAENRNIEQTLPIIDRALEANPHDKRIWATKGDALKLLKRPKEAAEAYLAAQRLEAASSQYVDRALKLDPKNPVALRMKLQLARSGGGEEQALEACEALLESHPKDPELVLEKARLLAAIGQLDAALATLQTVEAGRPEDAHVPFLKARLLFAMDRDAEALPLYRGLLEGKGLLDTVALGEVAADLEKGARDLDLALEARKKLHELDPRNLANLQALRTLAVARGRASDAIEASRAILEASPRNLDAERSLVDLLLAAGQTDEALRIGREILVDHPQESAELRRVLHAAQAAGKPDVIRDVARAIVQNEPDDTETQAALAAALAQLGEKEAALETYDALIHKQPNETRYWVEKKQLLVDLNRAEELPPLLDELFRLDPSRYDIALERGNVHLKAAFDHPEGSAEREATARAALVSYERATLDSTHRAASQLGLARASRLVHDHDRAVRAYREFLADSANKPRADVWKELGHVLRETDHLTEAEEAYENAVRLGLEDADLFWGLVETLSRLNQEAKALRFVDLLLQREAGNPLFLRRKGQLLLKAGRRPEGLAVLKSAVAAAKGDPHAFFEIAEALRGQGTYADAVAYYEQGLQVDPKSRSGRLGLAETLLVAGRFNEVLPIVDALLHEESNDLRAWKARADAHRALNHDAEVLYSLKAILLLDPSNSGALLERYRLHLKAGQKAEAFECLTQLLGVNGTEAESPGAWLEHGDLAAELGKAEESNRSYERAQTLDPERGVDIVTRRARLRLRAGRPDLALEIIDSTKSPDPVTARDRALPYLLLRAEILSALERPADAYLVFDQIRKVDARSDAAAHGMARSLLDQGRAGEARDFLRTVLPTLPVRAELFLLLSEAEAALGSVPNATEVVRKGVEVLPKSGELWVRLGELNVRQNGWDKAADAYAHAIALDRNNADLHLRAGFVAEKLGHSHEALTLYERATEIAPGNKYAWSSRGLAMLAVGRPDEAKTSFERALALDSDFEPAKEGKKASSQRTREATIERYGRGGLLLEAQLNRTVTKNDLFVTLHVPFDLLDPVLQILSRSPKVELNRLTDQEMRDLEIASYHLITNALEHRPAGVEERGLTLADVAVLSPPNYTLGQIQRVFGYLQAVLEADLRPENLRLTPDVEELARKALLLPEDQRTLFQLVRGLRVGVFKARLMKAVESAGRAVHAPLPSLDLGAYTPEFRGSESRANRGVAVPAAEGFAPTSRPIRPTAAFPRLAATSHSVASERPPPPHGPPSARCVGCGGIAAVMHICGALLCHHCISQFPSCPKCSRAVIPAESTPLEAAVPTASPAARERRGSSINPFRSLFGRAKSEKKEAESKTGPVPAPPGPHSASPVPAAGGAHAMRPPSTRSENDETAVPKGAPTHIPTARRPGATPPAPPPPPPEAPPPHPPRHRERTDEEPRL